MTPSPQAPDQPDDRDLDDGGLDLTPRTAGPSARRGSRPGTRRWVALAVLAGLAGVLVFIVVQARGASLYYRNVDEAVTQKAQLGTERFRLQGTVVGDPVRDGDISRFTLAYNGVSVEVRNTGAEPPLFKAGIPVVCEGHWSEDGGSFTSTRVLVKHTENYKKADQDKGDYEDKHPDRVEPDDGAASADRKTSQATG